MVPLLAEREVAEVPVEWCAWVRCGGSSDPYSQEPHTNRSCSKEARSGLADDKQKYLTLQQLPPALGSLFFDHLPLSEGTRLSTLMARPCSQDCQTRFPGRGGVGGEHNMLLLAVEGGSNMQEGLRFLNLYC